MWGLRALRSPSRPNRENLRNRENSRGSRKLEETKSRKLKKIRKLEKTEIPARHRSALLDFTLLHFTVHVKARVPTSIYIYIYIYRIFKRRQIQELLRLRRLENPSAQGF